jgi:membrane protein DedA with SNARE-associated domain
MLREIALWITNQVMSLGYFGIIFLMFIESSFIPFPSEIIMIPAGYLAYRGYFNIYLVIICGIIGSVLGASLNYWIAYKFGRPFLHNNAEKFFLTKERLKKVELFFQRHGAFSTFFGRLVPVIRQYISFPAGLARMNFLKFVIYTGLGAGIWIKY